MSRAKAKPFILSGFRVNYDAAPRTVIAEGLMVIEGSPQGNTRRAFARLTLAEAARLAGQLQKAIDEAQS